jgi:hypothetical protein
MAPLRHPLRDYIIGLFASGQLASIQEAALVCDASRQAIAKWIREAGIDVEARRQQYLAKRRTNAMRYLEGKPPKRKPSKRFLRRVADQAKRQWDRQHGAKQERIPTSGSRDPRRRGDRAGRDQDQAATVVSDDPL